MLQRGWCSQGVCVSTRLKKVWSDLRTCSHIFYTLFFFLVFPVSGFSRLWISPGSGFVPDLPLYMLPDVILQTCSCNVSSCLFFISRLFWMITNSRCFCSSCWLHTSAAVWSSWTCWSSRHRAKACLPPTHTHKHTRSVLYITGIFQIGSSLLCGFGAFLLCL